MKTMTIGILLAAAWGARPGFAKEPKMFAVESAITPRLQPFSPHDVRLLDGPFKEAQDRDAAYLLQLDPVRLLAGFRKEAGLELKAAPYAGWEAETIAGHSLGHYLSACAWMYAATDDARFRERVNFTVAELSACQEANGDGYVAATPDGKRIFAEVSRGDIRSQGFDLNGTWVPWYVMHKVMAGLRDAWVLCGNEQARDVLVKLADWAVGVTDALNDEQLQKMLRCEHGGMTEVAADVYALTGNQKYLELARRFNHKTLLDPLEQGEDRLAGLHANTQIPKLIGAAREYELTGEARFRAAAEFFWKTMTENHSYAIGGNSDREYLGPPGQLAKRLSDATAETCNTYNVLKLTRHVFAWSGSPECAEYYERALFNHILASQDPRDGMMTYYVPLRAGAIKTYSTPFDAFWCCVGTGMENHARYGEAIYDHDADGLYVNLFIASRLAWTDKRLTLRQETRFPEEGATRLIIGCEKPVEMILHVRRPAWATDGYAISINGTPQESDARPGSYASLRRLWRDGDMVDVRLPLKPRLEAMPDDPRRVALLCGPIVLAGALGESEPTADALPVLVCGERSVEKWLRPVADEPLTFETAGVGRPADVRLIPFYKMHHQHYAVYWDLFTDEQWKSRQAEFRAALQRQKELEARTVDFVQPGEMQPEREHACESEKSYCGEHQGRKWRDARGGGWFAFTLKVACDQPSHLICTYWGGDIGGREFDILVDGAKIATQILNNDRPGEFFDVAYELPAELIHGKETIRVKFQAHPDRIAGGVFGCRIVRP